MGNEENNLSRRDFLKTPAKSSVIGAIATGGLGFTVEAVQKRAEEIGLAEFLEPALLKVALAIAAIENGNLKVALQSLKEIREEFKKLTKQENATTEFLEYIGQSLPTEWRVKKN